MFNNRQHARTKKLALAGLIVGSLVASGCAGPGGILGVDRCADIPAGAIPEPAGSKVCNWQTAQIMGAVADQTVLYQADFIGRSSTLSPAAIARMARNVNSGLATMQPTLIEPSGDVSLDATRADAVNRQLASFGTNAPLVEIATPAAFGLQGPQSERVAGGLGSSGNSSSSTGAPTSQTSGLGGQGSFSGNLPGGIF